MTEANLSGGLTDVHHHCIPRVWREAAERAGIAMVAGRALPDWTPELSLALMDRIGTAKTILSLSAPGVHLGTREEAAALARACNTEIAEACRASGGRLGQWAVLPMPFAEESAAEAEYALDHLGAAGVVLLGSTDGVFLGDPSLEPLMDELDRRGAIVFVHPNMHPTSQTILPHIPGYFVEFLCDTTRAAMNMIFTGCIERHPRIRFILAHAGGFIPYISWRLASADHAPQAADLFPKGVAEYLRAYYYDTALSVAPATLNLLRDFAGAGHMLFGCDYPFAPMPVIEREVRDFHATVDTWSEEDRLAVTSGTAAGLLGA
ncbi:MAG: amidohydrolase family protein [Desulfovibrionaceae bacterium]|nr:amidohydrolase family protein [Desulfovibrionaceae bacterium]